MRTRVDAALQAVSADFWKNGFSQGLIERGADLFEAMPVETEDDRREHLAGVVRLIDYLLARCPAEVAEPLHEQRRAVQASFDQRYGRPDTAYLVTNAIVDRLQRSLQDGGQVAELVDRAGAELETMPIDGADDTVVKLGGHVRVQALRVAYEWFTTGAHAAPATALRELIRPVEEAFREGRLEPALVLATADAVHGQRGGSSDDDESLQFQLLLMGLGLRARPESAPALEPIRDRLFEHFVAVADAEPPVPTAAEPSALERAALEFGVGAAAAGVLGDYAATLARDGFSEYALAQVLGALRDLGDGPDGDGLAALVRVTEISIPYAPPDEAQMLRTLADTIVQWQQDVELPPITAEAMGVRCEAVLGRLRSQLAKGVSVGPAVMTALFALQLLIRELDNEDDDDAGLAVLMGSMEQVLQIMTPYVPAGSELTWREVVNSVGAFGDLVGSDEPAFLHAEEQAQALFSANDMHAVPEADLAAIPHVRQFLELSGQFSARLNAQTVSDDTTGDGAELTRLRRRFGHATDDLRGVPTEQEWLRHQRLGLRRIAVELRRFGARRHLMLIRPLFPTTPVTTDANTVFYSGTAAAEAALRQACTTLTLGFARSDGVRNHADARWQQLRQAAVAVFDYSAYDPRQADPPGPVPRSAASEADILRAAGPVATVAYEAGWATVLGTPSVVTAAAGRRVPFDITLAAVVLEDDGEDPARLVAALQAAFYGVQQEVKGSSVDATVDQVRRRHGAGLDADGQALLATIDGDATRARLVLQKVLDAAEPRAMLALPAFAGRYPPAGPPRLFHVTAFRTWALVAGEELRAVCGRLGVEYRIGSGRIGADVIGDIWNDLCEATFVVADITNLNPNAVFELAVAHALGKPTLIITQNAAPHAYLPAIDRIRTHHYDPLGDRKPLADLVEAFVTSSHVAARPGPGG
jgi:hypothetical protein